MPIISTSKLESIIVKELTRMASTAADKARSNASWSKTIPDAISVGQVMNEGGRYSIDIKLDARAEGPAPQAAAFEFGSGLHSKKQPGTYFITPKEKGANALAFHWSPERVPWGSPKFYGFAADGRYMFGYVEHPGVAARPYLQPAIQSTRKDFRSLLGRAFVKGIRESAVKVTVIK